MNERSRLKLFRRTLARRHRYHAYRAASMSLTLTILLAVPLLGVARIDLWGDRNFMLGEATDLAHGIAAVVGAIAGFYAVTFLINLIAGRMFCGFGCPIGQLHRLGDAVDAHPAGSGTRRRAWMKLGSFALLLAVAFLAWGVAPEAIFEGSLEVRVILLGAALAIAATAIGHARVFRWGFCRKLCPIGLYYSVVQTTAPVGLDYDPTLACTDCNACKAICPVSLDPRDLAEIRPSPGGLGLEGMPAMNHCLHCGACAEICEILTEKEPLPAALGLRRIRPTHAVQPTAGAEG